MQSCNVQVQPLEGEFRISLQLPRVLLLYLLWFWAFRGSRRIAWKLLCVRNCCLCLRNKSIWTSGGTRRSGTPPEVNRSSPLWLHARWETSAFLCRMKVRTFLTASTPACCSTGRARGMFVAGSRALPSGFCFLFFFLLASPLLQGYFEETVWLEVCLSYQRDMCPPSFWGLLDPCTGFREGRGTPALPGEGSPLPLGFGREEWLLGTNPSRKGGRWEVSRAWIWRSHWSAVTVSTQDQFWACFWGKSVGI